MAARLNDERCRHCGEPVDWDWIAEVVNSFTTCDDVEGLLTLCCDELAAELQESAPEYAPGEFERARFAAASDGKLRSFAYDAPHDVFRFDFALRVETISGGAALRLVRSFVGEHHRHNAAPVGWRWGHSIRNGPTLVGVVVVGRPVARNLPQHSIVEVVRNCVRADLPAALVRNACSQGYGAAAREAERRGFSRIITYTLAAERGTSLAAAGWSVERRVAASRGWNRPSRTRSTTTPHAAKLRWSRVLHPRSPRIEPTACAARPVSEQLVLWR